MNVGLSVKDFGAVGDGVTDDTAAFTACYDALTVPGVQIGGAIYVPAGEYIVNNWTWGTNGKTVMLYGEYGLSYLIPQNDAWAIIAPADAYPKTEWSRHSIRDICIDGRGTGNGIAHGIQSGIDYERVRLYRNKIGVHMNTSSYGDMFNVLFRENDIGMLVSSRTGDVQNPTTTLAFDPPSALTNNANKQFRHLNFTLNRCGIVFDTPFTGTIRHRYEYLSMESNKVALAVLPPDVAAVPEISLEFDRGHFEGNGVPAQEGLTTPIFEYDITQGDITAHHGSLSFTSFQTVTTARAYGDAYLDINDTNLWRPVVDTVYEGNVTSTRRAWGNERGGRYNESYNLVLPRDGTFRSCWARPEVHNIKKKFSGTILSLDGSHYEMPDGVVSFGLNGAGVVPKFGVEGGVFDRHQEVPMNTDSDLGYSVDLPSMVALVEGDIYAMMLTVKADIVGAEVKINASSLFNAPLIIDDVYRTYVWVGIYDGGKADFILNLASAATYSIAAWSIVSVESMLQLQNLIQISTHPTLMGEA